MKSNSTRYGRQPLFMLTVLAAVLFGFPRGAHALPTFARKYETSCTTCHTVYPMLTAFGEAFRRNGYRMPSHDGSLDSDLTKADSLELGQEEYKEMFPNSVWPDKLMKAVPLSVMANGGVAINLPNSEAKDSSGNTFTWDGIAQEFHLFGAGAFNDTLTYFSELTLTTAGDFSIESAYLLWNDVVGPAHWVNIWLGRLMAPQISSFGNHSSYVNDTFTPGISLAQLFNPNGTFVLGHNDSDGIELNGVVRHRFDYSVGWLASKVGSGISTIPNAQDAYAHIGGKIGGVTLDGEGPGGAEVENVERPWEDTALTLDAFVYHGLTQFTNPNANPAASTSGSVVPMQSDTVNAAGGSMRLQVKSFMLNSGFQFEHHTRPFGAASPAANAMVGVLDHSSAHGFTQWDEASYVIFPWLVPAVRMELTQLTHKTESTATLIRVLPGVALLPRQNIKVSIFADIESAKSLPPGGLAGGTSWSAAGAFVRPTGSNQETKAEQLIANVAMAY